MFIIVRNMRTDYTMYISYPSLFMQNLHKNLPEMIWTIFLKLFDNPFLNCMGSSVRWCEMSDNVCILKPRCVNPPINGQQSLKWQSTEVKSLRNDNQLKLKVWINILIACLYMQWLQPVCLWVRCLVFMLSHASWYSRNSVIQCLCTGHTWA